MDVIPVQSPRARPTNASNRKVTVQGRAKGCKTVLTTKPDACTGVSAESTDLIDTEVYVANPNFVKFTIDRQVYQDTCDSSDGNAAGIIAYKMTEAVESILKAENTEHIAALLAGVDNYFNGNASTPGGGTEQTINLYGSTVPRQPQPGNLFRLIDEYRRKGYTGLAPILTGGTTLGRWAFDAQIYSGNVDGADITRVPGSMPTFVDYEIDNLAQVIAGDANSRFLSWIPGHAQRLTYLDYAQGSPLRRTTDTITYTTMAFNVKGMQEVFDVTVYDSDCDHEVDITIGRHSDLFILPSTFFSTNCGGEQSILSWLTDCADTTCNDIRLPDNIIT